jgi:hypothetical protein
MSDLSICDTEELEGRVKHLVDQLDTKLKEVGPILEKIGRLRNEIMIITDELKSRAE